MDGEPDDATPLGRPDAAAAAIDKKLSSFSVYKTTAKDIKLSDLLQICNKLGYRITLTGHAINLDLLTYMTESHEGETKTKG